MLMTLSSTSFVASIRSSQKLTSESNRISVAGDASDRNVEGTAKYTWESKRPGIGQEGTKDAVFKGWEGW